MAVFIELTTDPFDDVRRQQEDIRRSGDDATSIAGRRVARRPLRGLEIKEDTIAAIKVVQADGTEIPLIDAGSPYGDGQTGGYTNFILQSVTEARMEKHQIVETFGEAYIFFFGESPRFLDVSLVVINSHDFNWEAEWWENYERYFRGTKLVEQGARLYMFYDDNVVEGYMLNSQGSKVSDQPLMVQMSFRLFVTGHRNITFIGDPQFPIRASVALPDNVSLTDPNSAGALFSNLRGIALSEAQAANQADAAALYSGSSEALFERSSLTTFLRSAPRTVALPPDIVQRIESLGMNPVDAIRDAGSALRGKIADNQDEYLGYPGEAGASPDYDAGTLGLPPALARTIRTQEEVEDLWLTVIDVMDGFGADVNNPQMLSELGLMPIFAGSGTGIGAGFQAGAGIGGGTGFGGDYGATFTPRSGTPFGTSLTSGLVSPNAEFDQSRRDPLGAVFGGGAVAQINTRATVQGGGDREYGYTSDFAARPGFGRPGFGDYGGNGFGSGQGAEGDPGFLDPDQFTFEGVSDNEAAFSRFNKPTRNSTVFGAGVAAGASAGSRATGRIGLGASNSGLSGGGATRIPGRPSCFSIVSSKGDLEFVEVSF